MTAMRSKALAVGATFCALIYLGPELVSARGFGGGHVGGGGGHFSGGQFSGGRFGGGHFGGGIGEAFHGARIGGLAGSHAFIRSGRAAWAGRAAWHHWGNSNWKTNWHSWHGGWGGWVGPVYWPYFFGDLFAFAFWPYGYFDPFWGYGDWFVWDALFWPGPYETYTPGYVYGPDPYEIYGGAAPSRQAKRSNDRISSQTTASIQPAVQSCGGIAPGVADLPVERIEKALQLSGEQRILLHAVNLATSKASENAKAACANAVPLTPLGRLDAVQRRIDSLLDGSDKIRTPLEAFYNSLSDEQQNKLRELGQTQVAQSRHRRATSSNDLAELCKQGAERFTNVPIERVQDSIKPTQEQIELFEQLKTASTEAANHLRTSCPTQTPQAPLDRLDAARRRLQAMQQAIQTVRPALSSFYAALTDEQKARFNVLGAPQNGSLGNL